MNTEPEGQPAPESSEIKSCRMCCMSIPAKARKCPYCHHFQTRLSMVAFHPGFAVFFAVLPVLAVFGFMGYMVQHMFDEGEDFQKHAGQIKVVQSELSFGESENGPTVAVIGKVRNNGDVNWKEALFHVEFRDANGKLIDASQNRNYYGTYVPAHGELGFKVSFRREFPEASYASHTIRVIAAKDGRAPF
jgi:hypothetical protein